MRVLVIGGTGFIGYHIVQALHGDGVDVRVLCRNTAAVAELFPQGVEAVCGDVDHLLTADYVQLLQGMDGVVFAAGADERSKITGDATEYFHRANVWPCQQLFEALPQTAVKHAVLLSSIFAWLDQQQPQLELAKQHPYIDSRVEQNRVAHEALVGSACVLTALQVPWVFGSSPHRASQWSALVSYVRAGVPLLCIRGGASMMSVQSLARAVCGALQYPVSSSSLPIGDENITYCELMQRLCKMVDRKDQRIRSVPDDFFRDMTSMGDFVSGVFGIQSGLDLSGMADILFQEMFFDASSSQALLHYGGGDLEAALEATVNSVPESFLVSGWRKTLNGFTW
jgi:dihydroflavonol-4-reductase